MNPILFSVQLIDIQSRQLHLHEFARKKKKDWFAFRQFLADLFKLDVRIEVTEL